MSALTVHVLAINCIHSKRRREIVFVVHKTKLVEIYINISLIMLFPFKTEIKMFTNLSLMLRDDHGHH